MYYIFFNFSDVFTFPIPIITICKYEKISRIEKDINVECVKLRKSICTTYSEH